MPPGAVKTIQDLIFWQYTKIIADSAGYTDNYGFIMKKFKQLQTGKIKWSSSIREYLKEREAREICIYCGDEAELTLEHILPRIRGGPNTTDNVVMVCKSCNSGKKDKRLYEWFGYENKDNVPRIAEGKYLKLMYDLHFQKDTLDISDVTQLCPYCDLGDLCPRKEKLSVFCLEGIFQKE